MTPRTVARYRRLESVKLFRGVAAAIEWLELHGVPVRPDPDQRSVVICWSESGWTGPDGWARPWNEEAAKAERVLMEHAALAFDLLTLDLPSGTTAGEVPAAPHAREGAAPHSRNAAPSVPLVDGGQGRSRREVENTVGSLILGVSLLFVIGVGYYIAMHLFFGGGQ